MDTILDYKYYKYIYRVSYITFFTSLYGFYTGHYHLAWCPAAIFLSSIYYWKKPDYSYRRYLDMAVVKTTILYQNCMVYNAQYANLYYLILFTGKSLYLLGRYFYSKKNYSASTYCHIGLHLMANLATIVVYSGHIHR